MISHIFSIWGQSLSHYFQNFPYMIIFLEPLFPTVSFLVPLFPTHFPYLGPSFKSSFTIVPTFSLPMNTPLSHYFPHLPHLWTLEPNFPIFSLSVNTRTKLSHIFPTWEHSLTDYFPHFSYLGALLEPISDPLHGIFPLVRGRNKGPLHCPCS